MRILICPDKFKGSLSAWATAEAIASGLREVYPDAEYELIPLADGGEGTSEVFVRALGGEWRKAQTTDALSRSVEARYGWVESQQLAIIEMSEAAGLWRLAESELNPLTASTFGVGTLLKDAIAQGAQRVYIGLGGSATNDGGAGMAAALGWRFLDTQGAEIYPVPANFRQISRIEPPATPLPVEICGLCDVRNPLLGPEGATRVYGPQKGAETRDLEFLEAALKHLADLFTETVGSDCRDVPGSGAAGGLGFGLLSFCKAEIVSGFATIEKLLSLRQRIADADLIITGEGRIDGQSLHGKAPAEVALVARACGKPVIAFAGSVEGTTRLFDAIIPIADGPLTLDESRHRAADLLRQAAARTAHLLKIVL